MAKAGFGRIKKLPSGRYRADYQRPDMRGAQHYQSRIAAPVTFTSKTGASAWLAEQRTLIEKGLWKSPEQLAAEKEAAARQAEQDGVTFGEFCENFLEIYKTRWGTETYRKYRSNYRSWLKPHWGNIPLKQITTASVSTWLATLDLSGAGYKNPVNFFSRVLNAAHEDFELLSFNPAANPVRKLAKGGKAVGTRSQRHEAAALTMNELIALADEITPKDLRLWVLLGGLLGLRVGEIRALRRSSFDFEKGLVNITSAVTGAGKFLDLHATPKTKTSVRTLAISPALEAEIRHHIEQFAEFSRDAWLFPSPVDPNKPRGQSSASVQMKKACKRLGLEPHTSHDLRHTTASLLAKEGVPAVAVKSILGHAHTEITARYTHPYAAQNAKALNQLGEEFTAASDAANVLQLPERKQA